MNAPAPKPVGPNRVIKLRRLERKRRFEEKGHTEIIRMPIAIVFCFVLLLMFWNSTFLPNAVIKEFMPRASLLNKTIKHTGQNQNLIKSEGMTQKTMTVIEGIKKSENLPKDFKEDVSEFLPSTMVNHQEINKTSEDSQKKNKHWKFLYRIIFGERSGEYDTNPATKIFFADNILKRRMISSTRQPEYGMSFQVVKNAYKIDDISKGSFKPKQLNLDKHEEQMQKLRSMLKPQTGVQSNTPEINGNNRTVNLNTATNIDMLNHPKAMKHLREKRYADLLSSMKNISVGQEMKSNGTMEANLSHNIQLQHQAKPELRTSSTLETSKRIKATASIVHDHSQYEKNFMHDIQTTMQKTTEINKQHAIKPKESVLSPVNQTSADKEIKVAGTVKANLSDEIQLQHQDNQELVKTLTLNTSKGMVEANSIVHIHPQNENDITHDKKQATIQKNLTINGQRVIRPVKGSFSHTNQTFVNVEIMINGTVKLNISRDTQLQHQDNHEPEQRMASETSKGIEEAASIVHVNSQSEKDFMNKTKQVTIQKSIEIKGENSMIHNHPNSEENSFIPDTQEATTSMKLDINKQDTLTEMHEYKVIPINDNTNIHSQINKAQDFDMEKKNKKIQTAGNLSENYQKSTNQEHNSNRSSNLKTGETNRVFQHSGQGGAFEESFVSTANINSKQAPDSKLTDADNTSLVSSCNCNSSVQLDDLSPTQPPQKIPEDCFKYAFYSANLFRLLTTGGKDMRILTDRNLQEKYFQLLKDYSNKPDDKEALHATTIYSNGTKNISMTVNSDISNDAPSGVPSDEQNTVLTRILQEISDFLSTKTLQLNDERSTSNEPEETDKENYSTASSSFNPNFRNSETFSEKLLTKPVKQMEHSESNQQDNIIPSISLKRADIEIQLFQKNISEPKDYLGLREVTKAVAGIQELANEYTKTLPLSEKMISNTEQDVSDNNNFSIFNNQQLSDKTETFSHTSAPKMKNLNRKSPTINPQSQVNEAINFSHISQPVDGQLQKQVKLSQSQFPDNEERHLEVQNLSNINQYKNKQSQTEVTKLDNMLQKKQEMNGFRTVVPSGYEHAYSEINNLTIILHNQKPDLEMKYVSPRPESENGMHLQTEVNKFSHTPQMSNLNESKESNRILQSDMGEKQPVLHDLSHEQQLKGQQSELKFEDISHTQVSTLKDLNHTLKPSDHQPHHDNTNQVTQQNVKDISNTLQPEVINVVRTLQLSDYQQQDEVKGVNRTIAAINEQPQEEIKDLNLSELSDHQPQTKAKDVSPIQQVDTKQSHIELNDLIHIFKSSTQRLQTGTLNMIQKSNEDEISEFILLLKGLGYDVQLLLQHGILQKVGYPETEFTTGISNSEIKSTDLGVTKKVTESKLAKVDDNDLFSVNVGTEFIAHKEKQGNTNIPFMNKGIHGNTGAEFAANKVKSMLATNKDASGNTSEVAKVKLDFNDKLSEDLTKKSEVELALNKTSVDSSDAEFMTNTKQQNTGATVLSTSATPEKSGYVNLDSHPLTLSKKVISSDTTRKSISINHSLHHGPQAHMQDSKIRAEQPDGLVETKDESKSLESKLIINKQETETPGTKFVTTKKNSLDKIIDLGITRKISENTAIKLVLNETYFSNVGAEFISNQEKQENIDPSSVNKRIHRNAEPEFFENKQTSRKPVTEVTISKLYFRDKTSELGITEKFTEIPEAKLVINKTFPENIDIELLTNVGKAENAENKFITAKRKRENAGTGLMVDNQLFGNTGTGSNVNLKKRVNSEGE